jgi:hypothetical protein
MTLDGPQKIAPTIFESWAHSQMTRTIWTGSRSNPSSWLLRLTSCRAGFFTSASTTAKFIATSPSPPINTTSSSRPNPKAATSSVTSEIASPTKNSLANKRLPWSDQDGVCLTLTVFRSKQDFLITQQAPRINDSKRLRNPS